MILAPALGCQFSKTYLAGADTTPQLPGAKNFLWIHGQRDRSILCRLANPLNFWTFAVTVWRT
jgi:hypothetical protein